MKIREWYELSYTIPISNVSQSTSMKTREWYKLYYTIPIPNVSPIDHRYLYSEADEWFIKNFA